MDTFVKLPKDRRSLFFSEAASRLNSVPTVIEKDFWVCWAIKQLFSIEELRSHLTFKGGTSLSKVYGVISRFSEDIDLTIGKQYLGIVDEDDPLTAPSRKSRTKRLKQLVFRAETAVGETIYSLLNERFGQYLSDEWSLTVDKGDLQILLFDYPKVENRNDKQMHYIKRVVRLEFGARGDPWPTEEHIITPYVAEALPDQFTQSQIAVNVLKIVRTFWEKISLLHSEFHRPVDNKFRERVSRHYYDVVMLARRGIHQHALEMPALLDDVVKNKQIYFASAWAAYDTTRLGTLKLVPTDDVAKSLEDDYKRMSVMFFEEPPDFETLLRELGELEIQLNAGHGD